MVHINTSFNLPVALKPLSCLEKGLYGHLHLHIHFFWTDLSSLGMSIIFIHIIQIFCLKLLTFHWSVIVPFSITWTLKTGEAQCRFLRRFPGNRSPYRSLAKKRHNEKTDHLARLVLKNIHGTLSLEIRNYGITSDSGRSSAPETTANCRLPKALERKSIILLFDFCDIKWF